jgi:hypothetical protein
MNLEKLTHQIKNEPVSFQSFHSQQKKNEAIEAKIRG